MIAMKKLLLTFLITAGAINLCSSQQQYYDVSSGTGNGVRFWQPDATYKIHMGYGTEYFYGPVSDYSIKTNMAGAPLAEDGHGELRAKPLLQQSIR